MHILNYGLGLTSTSLDLEIGQASSPYCRPSAYFRVTATGCCGWPCKDLVLAVGKFLEFSLYLGIPPTRERTDPSQSAWQ